MIEVVLFDVDDVVIDTDAAGAAAERSVAEPLSKYLPRELAEQVAAGLSAGYELLRRQLRRPAGERPDEFVAHEERIRGWQKGVLAAGFELKLWSRDSLLAIALEDAGVPVTHPMITEAAAHYWRVLASETRVYEDAKRIIDELLARGIAVHLSTNSDGFLSFDAASGGFAYDPEDAVRKKIERLACLDQLRLSAIDVSVGDPIGKPKRAFYEKVLAEVAKKLGRAAVDPTRLLPVGDSLTNDVLPLLELGAPRGAWLVRASQKTEQVEGYPNVLRIPTLDDLHAKFFQL
jgi:FMN phosphatase YigB (HAD superfamily)